MPDGRPRNSFATTCQFFQWDRTIALRSMYAEPRRGDRVMDFTAVAHDLRAALHVMHGHMQLLALEDLGDTGRKRLEVLEAQVLRMKRLLDSSSSQSDAGGLGPVDLNITIRNVMSELEALLERRRINIRLTTTGIPPCVQGDSDLLHRVLLNILINAVDSIPSAGIIEITTHTERIPGSSDGTVHIEVADTGAGIAPELVPRVFDPGFTTKGGADTHGNGLSICREIIQMHGGEIHLSSVSGQGTTVSLTLPINPELHQYPIAS